MAKRNKNNLPPEPHHGVQPRDAAKEARARRLMILLIINSIIIISSYFVLNTLNPGPAFFIAYIGAAAVLLLIYVIYNRGFVYQNATPEMLDANLSYEERVRILEQAAQRNDRSRWMLTVILPLLLALMLDALYLFIFSDIFAAMGIT